MAATAGTRTGTGETLTNAAHKELSVTTQFDASFHQEEGEHKQSCRDY